MIITKKKIVSLTLAFLMLFLGATFKTGTKALAEETQAEETVDDPFSVSHEENKLLIGMRGYTIDSEEIQEVLKQIPPFESRVIFNNDHSVPSEKALRIYVLTFESGYKEAYAIISQYPDLLKVDVNHQYENAAEGEIQNQEYHKGDINGDNEITSTDYLSVKNAFLNAETYGAKEFVMADIDNSGELDSTDYMMIKAHFLKTAIIGKDGFYNGKNVTEYNNVIDEKTEAQIKNDYLACYDSNYEYFAGDVRIRYLSGAFNGAYVMMINFVNSSYPQMIEKITVGGVHFTFYSSQQLMVWKDGVFYSLEEAYEQNILSSDELGIANSVYRICYTANVFAD